MSVYICGRSGIIGLNANSFLGGVGSRVEAVVVVMNKLHPLGCSVRSGLGAAEKSPGLQLLINLQEAKKTTLPPCTLPEAVSAVKRRALIYC